MTDDLEVFFTFFAVVLIISVGVFAVCGAFTLFSSDATGYRRKWCEERLLHAATAKDTVMIYQDDSYCVKEKK